ncbi:hydrogenase formation protein HypD [Bradyrhizobium sp. ISRA443]|uniref:hydrogenase formation protein HypD n=1 Tax=unclassified Bradyrhizobium TaxID=2631580 RepID=UPI0024791C5A|nr:MULTISPECIES: hydrogenase formation protein HypD [unclassified Bradyrhizobium]WGR98174.1 hydrogenase formation protein HypD [Bradyrhizobium sp. ISRA436]WGS05063.1 hydrogenase formation protein HypD [Bradyrhizobium sp. ISRA437]WGS11948.1 hydrogenase formation protein HypD [Bradyrhizobium sp. ISRA443]
MKYVVEFRNKTIAQGLAGAIGAEADLRRAYRFMEFCGGHTHAISRYGLEDLLPANIRLIHGPGCPVCVLPASRIDMAIRLADRTEVTVCVYGDLMRAPGSQGQSLLRAKALGADIRMVYSTLDAIRIAEQMPKREVVFFAIGFETTTPATAVMVRLARKKRLKNLSVFCNHVLTPSAMHSILKNRNAHDIGRVEIHGFVGPAHVSTIIGTEPYESLAEEFGKPIVIAGFEPLDVMQAILMLVRQVNQGRHEVENQYSRAVKREGNRRAKEEVLDIFELRDPFEWRGLGLVPNSGLKLKQAYAQFDAEVRFSMHELHVADNPVCECCAILRGMKRPVDCKLFGTACTPETPIGACMVSSEGACAAYWTYGRLRDYQPKRVSRE